MAQTLDLRSTWNWLALVAVLAGFPIFLGLLVGHISSVARLFRGDHRYWGTFWGITVAVAWTVVLVVVACVILSGRGIHSIGIIAPSLTDVFIGIVVVAVLLVLTVAASAPAGTPVPCYPKEAILPHTRSERLFWLLVISPSAAVCEEIAYRGFLLTFLRTILGLWLALAIQALIFGFHHGGHRQGLRPLLGRAGFGLTLGLITLWKCDLLAAVALHFGVNALLSVRPSRPPRPEFRSF